MNYERVAVVGGGCSGVLAVRELLFGTDRPVTLIEPGEPGGGVAYGRARPWHLLNSRAGAMSADPDDAGHFARWAGAGPDDFLPRADYGRYLREVLDHAVAAHPGRLTVRRARAIEVAGTEVRLDDGTAVDAGHVVLAMGNPAGAHPSAIPAAVRAQPAYVADPWRPGAVEAIDPRLPVLLIGTGLTAIDVALTLAADGDRRAPIVAVSRRGLLPLTHTAEATPPRPPAMDDCASLRDVIRAVREAAGEVGDWRAVVDGLRPQLDRVWGALTEAEQEAFLRHLARPWECHRHRMAPAIAGRVAELRESGALVVRPGGVRGIAIGPDAGLTATLASAPTPRRADAPKPRRADAPEEPRRANATEEPRRANAPEEPRRADAPTTRRADAPITRRADALEAPRRGDAGDPMWFGAVVNCSGPGRLPGAADPLTRSLLASGSARIGPHALGLDIDPDGHLRAADGTPDPRLHVLGPLRRGTQWETTAVPEIRAQARLLARSLASRISNKTDIMA